MSATVKVTDASFEADVLKASQPVLLDFWAEWCGPCKAIAPTLDALAQELQGKVVVAKINIDENPATPNRYRVQGIPTLTCKGRCSSPRAPGRGERRPPAVPWPRH